MKITDLRSVAPSGSRKKNGKPKPSERGTGRAGLRLLLALCAMLFAAAGNMGTTAAWFLDSGQWLDGSYRMGFLNYDVMVNDASLEILRDGQELQAAVPIVGGVKLDDREGSGADDGTGRPEGPHAEEDFDQGVTLLRVSFRNTGDIPVYSNVELDFGTLSQQGILAMPLPDGAVVDEEALTIRKTTGSAVKGYKAYIRDELAAEGLTWNRRDYDGLALAVASYWERQGGMVKAKHVLKVDDEGLYTVNVLVWAEYEKWTDAAGVKRDDGVQSTSGPVVLTITVVPAGA